MRTVARGLITVGLVVGLSFAWLAGAPTPKKPKDITNSIGMKLVLIPKGKFKMGSPKTEQDEVYRQLKDALKLTEKPDWLKAEEQHEVEITKPFYLGAYEVTQEEFTKVMGYNPSYFSADSKGKAGVTYSTYSKPAGGKDKVKGLRGGTGKFPVENVSREDALEFCKKLSAMAKEKAAGRVYRLPTEAEWESACRAGAGSRNSSVFHFGNSLSSKQANFNGNSPYGGAAKGADLGRTCAVGSYKPNAFGLYDMHGNVCEWVHDWYDKDYYKSSPARDPRGPSTGAYRVSRGGSWSNDAGDCRSAYRSGFTPACRSFSLGFRVVVVPSGKRTRAQVRWAVPE